MVSIGPMQRLSGNIGVCIAKTTMKSGFEWRDLPRIFNQLDSERRSAANRKSVRPE